MIREVEGIDVVPMKRADYSLDTSRYGKPGGNEERNAKPSSVKTRIRLVLQRGPVTHALLTPDYLNTRKVDVILVGDISGANVCKQVLWFRFLRNSVHNFVGCRRSHF